MSDETRDEQPSPAFFIDAHAVAVLPITIRTDAKIYHPTHKEIPEGVVPVYLGAPPPAAQLAPVEEGVMDNCDRTATPAGFDEEMWRSADEVHHATALIADDAECVKIIYAALNRPAAPVQEGETISCERCQGNGEIVTDWERYKHPGEGDTGDEAVAECPDCNGTGYASPPASKDKGEVERLRKIIGSCDWYWPENQTSSDDCADGPWQIAENLDIRPGMVLAYSRGGVVETRYYGYLPPAKDSDSDDNFEVDEATEVEAKAKLKAERSRRRRAALGKEG